MGTKIGKALVFANVFVSIGLLAWAVSIYINRPTYFDTKDGDTPVSGQFAQYAAEVKRLSDGVQTAQAGYVRDMDFLVIMEQDRSFRLYTLNIILDEVRKPNNPDAFFRVLPRHTEPTLSGLVDVSKYSPNNPFPTAPDLRNKPLKGFGRLRRDMADAMKDEKDKLDQIAKLREERQKFSEEIIASTAVAGEQVGVQPEVFKMKAIFQNLGDEEQFLADSQVNWEEQLRTLSIRKAQLLARLNEYKAAAAGGKGE